MKTKQLSLMLVSLMAIVLAMGMASAFSGDLNPSSGNFNDSGDTVSTTLENFGSNINTSVSSGDDAFGVENTTSTKNQNSVRYDITLDNMNAHGFGEHNRDIKFNVVNSSNSTNETTKTFDAEYTRTFCEQGANKTKLQINDFDIVNNGNGDDDEWHPLDTIEVEVEFENDRDDEIEDAVFELGIYDEGTSSGNLADDVIWISEEDEQFESGEDVDEGDELSHTFEFKIDPDEFTDDGDYDVTAKIYEEGNEQSACISESSEMGSDYYENVDVDYSDYEDEDEMVVVDTESYSEPVEATCGAQTRFSADVWNVGDQDFERVDVNLRGEKFDIDKKQNIGELDENEDKEVFFSFTIPKGTNPDELFNNRLEMFTRAYEDRNEENQYETSSDTFNVDLSIQGDCSIPKANIPSASLDSGSTPKSGGSFTMTTTIQNSGESQTTYSLGLSDHTSWVSNYQTNRNSFTLNPGESTQVQVSVNVREEVKGNKSFNLQVSSDGEMTNQRTVEVEVQPAEEEKGISLDSIKIDSMVPILLALIAAALIAIGIVLIVRASKNKKKTKVTPGVADF